ncbi:MAG: Sec-independent protein translocase protein TatB [Litorimonas sp.]
MLPSFGFGEMVVIALLAIIVVGPRDLPKLMRTLGGFMARIRMMGQEFRDAFDEMDADDEIKALRQEIAQMKDLGFLDEDLKDDLRDLDTDLRDGVDRSSDKT